MRTIKIRQIDEIELTGDEHLISQLENFIKSQNGELIGEDSYLVSKLLPVIREYMKLCSSEKNN